jgi:hypothetical protein
MVFPGSGEGRHTCIRGRTVGSYRYRVVVSGRLGTITRRIFEDMSVEYDGKNTGLTGELDQAGLYGVLNRIPAFGLELVALSRLDEEPSRQHLLG